MKRIRDILQRHKTPVAVEDGVVYKQVTIRTKYKGVVLRGTKEGSTIGTKNQWEVSADQFILSRIDARNGAFGIIPEELEGAIVTNDFLAYDINESEVDREFFNIFLQSPVFLEACIKASRGNTNRKRVDEEFFLDYEVNLPALSAQKDLIKRINVSQTQIGTAQSEIETQQSLLTKLKQAILQEAIQGDLTADWRAEHADDPDVEPARDLPARDLLARIQTEKARLIAEKKIRKEKPLPEITEDEIPFDIPDGWEWCRLSEIAIHSLGKMLDAGKNEGELRPYLRNLNVQWFEIRLDDVKQMRIKDSETEKYGVQRGDVLICEGGYPGQAAIWNRSETIFFQKALHRVRFCKSAFDSTLFVHYLKLSDSVGFLADYYTGAGIKHFTGKSLAKFPIPLPPLAEQAVIVERVEALMETCAALEAEIERSRSHAENLLQAVLKEAFAPSSSK